MSHASSPTINSPQSFEAITHPTTYPNIQPLGPEQLADIQSWVTEIISDEDRLTAMSEQIAEAVEGAAGAGHFILARSATDIANKLHNGMAALIPGRYPDGKETFHYFRGMMPLVVADHLDQFPVIEGGTLIANPRRKSIEDWKNFWSSHAVQIANSLPTLPDNVVIINTSRSLQSKRAGLRAGAVMLRRAHFPMLDALTCDPGCSPGSDGRIAGVERVIEAETGCGNCIACPVNEAFGGDELSDGCYLLTPDPERAFQMEQSLQAYFGRQATRARAVLIDGETNAQTA